MEGDLADDARRLLSREVRGGGWRLSSIVVGYAIHTVTFIQSWSWRESMAMTTMTPAM